MAMGGGMAAAATESGNRGLVFPIPHCWSPSGGRVFRRELKLGCRSVAGAIEGNFRNFPNKIVSVPYEIKVFPSQPDPRPECSLECGAGVVGHTGHGSRNQRDAVSQGNTGSPATRASRPPSLCLRV